jgi:hypothetical protein
VEVVTVALNQEDAAALAHAEATSGGLSGRARASWRRARALELAMAGHDYDTIAQQVGFSHRASAWRAVDEALTERVADNADQYRALTMARLEKLLASHWIDATEHADTKAADLVLKVMAQQVKLMGLDQLRQTADQVQTLVIGGTSAEYIAALQQIAERPAQLTTAERNQDRNGRP